MRVVGVNVPDNKRVDIALTYIYGLGRSNVLPVLEKAKIAFVGTDRGDGMVLSIGKGEVYFIFNNDFMLVEVTDV